MNWTETFKNQLPQLKGIFVESLKRVAVKQAELEELRPIPFYLVQKLQEQINVEWSYNSNAIEGNTITLSETQLILQHGVTVKGKSFKEHLEISNHHDAIEFVTQLADQNGFITQADIRSIHELILLKIEKEFAGKYRTGSVRIAGAKFQPPGPEEIQLLMTELLDFVSEGGVSAPFSFIAAVLHHRFVWIHPFFDGNGRTGRLLLNLFLMKRGLPPAVILKNDRKKYYDALSKADAGDYEKLILIVLQSIERSLDLYLSALKQDRGGYKPIEVIVQEESVPYNQEYVSLLARRGKIDAYKEHNVWFTTETAIQDYVATRKRNRFVKTE